MTNDTVRLVAVDEHGGDGDTAQVLQRLQERTLELLAGLARAPKSLRIRAGDIEVELEWPLAVTPVAAAAPDGTLAPAAGQPPAVPAGVPAVHSAATRPVAAGVAAGVASGGDAQPAGAGAVDHITAHTVGVFHHAPAPGAEPFVA